MIPDLSSSAAQRSPLGDGGSKFCIIQDVTISRTLILIFDDGIIHPNARMIGKLQWVQWRTYQCAEVAKDDPLYGLH